MRHYAASVGTVSYLHMHLLVQLHGQPGWVAVLTPLSDGMIVAASTTLLAESRSGGRGGFLPWGLLVAGSAASLAANVAVAEPTAAGRIIAAWPSFALIGSYELLMRQIRATATAPPARSRPARWTQTANSGSAASAPGRAETPPNSPRAAGGSMQEQALQWAIANRGEDGKLPTGRAIGERFGRHERWGRLVKQHGDGRGPTPARTTQSRSNFHGVFKCAQGTIKSSATADLPIAIRSGPSA
jgi:Protein of unknown function (DUF2637)